MKRRPRQSAVLQKEGSGGIRRILKEFSYIRYGIILGMLIALVSTACQLTAPKVLSKIIDSINDYWVLKKQGINNGDLLSIILDPILLLVVFYLAYFVLDYLKILTLTHFVSKHFTPSVRIRISDKISRLPVSFIDKTKPGYILSVMTGDVSVFGTSIYAFFDQALLGFIKISAILTIVFLSEWKMGLVLLALPILVLAVGFVFLRNVNKYYESMFKQNEKLYSLVEETYGNIETVKVFLRQGETENKHNEINSELKKASMRANYASMRLAPIFTVICAALYVCTALVGGYIVVSGGSLTVGGLIAIIFYLQMLQAPIEQLGNAIGNIQQLRASSKRIFALLDEPEMESCEDEITIKDGNICFSDVEFCYNDNEPLIQNLNLSVKSGQKVAIVGPTGGGKTTIVNLLMRFYDPKSGKITIDGIDTAKVSAKSVRSLFALVLQDTWLFNGTVAQNIAYGKDNATEQEVEAAAKKAFCDNFIRALPNGYDTLIDPATLNISGGQKQLLTIARAILANKPLLILDEATSNVDTRTEGLIQRAMDELMENKTCFIIAHRLSTIINADIILVVDNGAIVEKGKHDELINRKGFYYELFNSQYNL